jgi:hypothetical protein
MNTSQLEVLAQIVDLHCKMIEIGDALSIAAGEYRQGNLAARHGIDDLIWRLGTNGKLLDALAEKFKSDGDRT